ncbi:MAG TPA: YggS family pyridoxal phosphate enzyme [Acidimicrobiales bacterium]|nr:YggS family pyridoxal phosphate enzyme [Acidimicrobiales bacterium]
MNVESGLAAVRQRIEAAGVDPDQVRIIAMTKGFGPEAVAAALGAGHTDLGENYAQELLTKLVDGVTWHFLGPIQRNKVGTLAPHVALWQAVDRPAAGTEIARRSPGAAVLVQLNVVGDPERPGVDPTDAPVLVRFLRDLGLDVQGLMAVAAVEPDRAREGFRTVRRVADDLGLPVRSMGMTDDLETAVAEGSTMVRVGRALFGPRPGRP